MLAVDPWRHADRAARNHGAVGDGAQAAATQHELRFSISLGPSPFCQSLAPG